MNTDDIPRDIEIELCRRTAWLASGQIRRMQEFKKTVPPRSEMAHLITQRIKNDTRRLRAATRRIKELNRGYEVSA